MFTRCPACETTFRLGASDLRRAQGRVRCGECSSVFNALAYLAEEPEEAAGPATDSWLPEAANDSTVPDDRGAILSPTPEPSPSDGDLYLNDADAGEESAGDVSTPLDIYSAFDAEEPISTSRWNEALQRHEQAETGLNLAVPLRSDYLSLDELAHEADDLTVSQPVLPEIPDQNEASLEDDFDDTIWERIPGVGAQGEQFSRPIDLDNDRSVWPEQPLPGSGPAQDNGADDIDPLEFNAPEETWSNIFVSSPNVAADDDDDVAEYPEPLAEDAESADNNEMARLEQVFNPERIAALMRERPDAPRNEDSAVAQTFAESAEGSYSANPTDPDVDIAERRRNVADWLTEDEVDDDPDATSDDELPEDGYDVQHIILPDESEPAYAPQAENLPATAARKDDTVVWQAKREKAPARSGLWLGGGLLLLATLVVQLVHYNRDSLAASPVWGGMVSGAYNLLGMELFPAWSVDDYEIRSAEVVTGESGPDIMDIRAQIAVIGSAPTGLPYLRAVLSDRWAKPVAEKTFSPADYSAAENQSADRLLLPGQSIEVHVSIVDPGTGAQGFELELCLPRRHTGMECTGRPFK